MMMTSTFLACSSVTSTFLCGHVPLRDVTVCRQHSTASAEPRAHRPRRRSSTIACHTTSAAMQSICCTNYCFTCGVWSVCLYVCLLVTPVTNKTAEPIEVPFGPRNHGSDGGTDPLWGKGHLLGRILEHTQACPRSTFSTLFAKRHHLATGAVTICYLLLPRSAKMRPIATDVAWSVCVSVCSSRPAGCAVDWEPCYVGT